jgi:hypothetical protein
MSVVAAIMDGMLENKLEILITRSAIDRDYGLNLTDKQWEVLAVEIDALITGVIETDLPDIIDNLEYLVEQDSKYD